MKIYINIYLACFLLLNISPSLFGQDNKPEAIAEELYTEISKNIRARNVDSTLNEIQKFHKYSSDNKLGSYIGKAESLYADCYLSNGNKDSALYYFKIAEKTFALEEDASMQGKMNAKMAWIYKSIGELDLSIASYEKSTSLLLVTVDTLWHGIISNNLGKIYYNKFDYINALRHLNNSIKAFRLLEDYLKMGSAYNAISLIYRETNNRAKEKESYLKGIEALKSIDETKELGTLYNNLAEIYFDEGSTALGLETLEKAKAIYEKAGYEKGLIGYYSVLAYYYYTSTPPNYEKAIEYNIKKIELSEVYESYVQYTDGISYLGKLYVQTKQYKRAQTILEEGLSVAEELDYYEESKNICYPLAIAYEQLGMPQKAYEALEKHLAYKDSVSNEEKIQEFTKLDEKYKYEQQMRSDSLEQVQIDRELEFKHQKEIQEQDRILLITGFIALLLLGTAIFIFIYARKRKKQAKALDEKNSIINKTLSEKELLLKEIHHRVKNNLQIISSLLDLQSKNIEDEKALSAVSDGQSRVKAMALIHQKLYQNDNLAIIDFKEYCKHLLTEIQVAFNNKASIETRLEINNIELDIDTAIPLGLILNELITNVFKYAFNDDSTNNLLSISISKDGDKGYLLSVKDNGCGLAPDFDISKTKSFGLRLARRLSKQLLGKLSYTYDNGSVFNIRFLDVNQRNEFE